MRITKPFYVGAQEVTQAQYQQVMGTNPSHFQNAQHPVDSVSWEDAVRFCEKLSALAEEKTAGHRYRLPTEAEWEYACRAGHTTRFSCGESDSSLGDYAWHRENSGLSPHAVGQKRPNAWGLYDMHGNVWEWCADWYEDDADRKVLPADDPTGPATGSDRVYRGGSLEPPTIVLPIGDPSLEPADEPQRRPRLPRGRSPFRRSGQRSWHKPGRGERLCRNKPLSDRERLRRRWGCPWWIRTQSGCSWHLSRQVSS